MADKESSVRSERITVKEYAAHIGGWFEPLSVVGRKASGWCRRNGVPTGEAERRRMAGE